MRRYSRQKRPTDVFGRRIGAFFIDLGILLAIVFVMFFSLATQECNTPERLEALLCCLPQVPVPAGLGYDAMFRIAVVEFLELGLRGLAGHMAGAVLIEQRRRP